MSKINRVLLLAWVAHDSRVLDDGENYKAVSLVNCITNNRSVGDHDPILSTTSIIVASYNKQNGRQIENLKENDIVSIKGTYTTAPVEKGSKACPGCGKAVTHAGQIAYVSPIAVTVIGHADSREDAQKFLLNSNVQEVSNEVFIEGNVCSPPKIIETIKTTTAIQYQIAAPRTYKLLESINEDTDFPWIHSFGDKAQEQLEKINIGTQVLVNGRLNPRKFSVDLECPECGAMFKTTDTTLEIVPYDVEFLRNYNEKGGEKGYFAK